MYQTYWGLRGRPFDNDSDRRCYFPAQDHEEALLRLRYAIESRKGAALLLGETGLGKSYLVRVLALELDPTRYRLVTLQFPQFSPQEMLAYLAVELGADSRELETGPGSFDRTVRQLERQIEYYARQELSPVLVVDEAHLIDDSAVFQTLRLLLNVQPLGSSPLTLLMLGEPELAPQVARVPSLADRVAARCILKPFSPAESAGYVAHRLAEGGAKRALFTPAALRRVHECTGGAPRRINRVCDLALLLGFAEEAAEVLPAHVETAAAEFESTALRRAA